MSQFTPSNYHRALRDFQNARQQAVMQQLLERFRGEGAGLLPFDEIKDQLHPTGETIEHGTQEIPLDKIVGSVARYKDFTRSFLPKRDADLERWAGVRAAVHDMSGMPPIDVYQVGDAYFVQDGNHRVSIARRLDSRTITAHVTEVKTRVSFSADDDPNEIICKAHYADFLEQTNLDQLRPDADLMMTFSGQYQVFLDQITAVLQDLSSGADTGGDSRYWPQAVVIWYDQIYLPVIHIIRELGVLHRFRERTEADMYLLLSERRTELEADLGWQVDMESGVSDLIAEEEQPRSLFRRVWRTITFSTDRELHYGLWRQQQLARGRYHHLFKHILMPLDGTEENWYVFNHYMAHDSTDDHLLGLHVVRDESQIYSPKVRQMRERFLDGMRSVGLEGEFAVEVSDKPVEIINKRAAWADLVVARGTRPKGVPLEHTSPEMKLLVEQCPRPIQITPDGTQSDFSRLILAYDGSPKSDEALFTATYLTSRWQKSLTVVTVETPHTNAEDLERARSYIEQHGLDSVNYVLTKGDIAQLVLDTAAEYNCNYLIMGGFSFRSLRHLTLGSSAERVLLEYPHPMLICR